MNTFITGGAGFIGSGLTRQLRRSTNRVIVYDITNAGPVEDRDPARFLTIRGDIRDSEALQSAISQARPDLVIHLAAVHHIPFCESNPAIAHATNVVGTHNLLNVISRLRYSPTFIFASSAAVYADTEVAVSETSRIGPIDTYGRTKFDAEQLVLDFRQSGRLTNCTILRLFNVYGPGDVVDHVIPSIIRQLKTSSRISLGRVDVARDFVYLDDVVEAIRRTSTMADGQRVLNIGTGVAYRVQEVVSFMSELLHVKIDVREDQSLVRPEDRKCLVADISRTGLDLSWQPKVTLREGLSRVLRHERLLRG